MPAQGPAPVHHRIGLATVEDLEALRDVDRAAGLAFRDVGMPEAADGEPLLVDVLDRYRRAGLCWVAVDGTGSPRAYARAEPLDGALHVEQVSVHPSSARLGVGRRLLGAAAARAAVDGAPALTLTTFARGSSGSGRLRTAWTAGRGSACAGTSRGSSRRTSRGRSSGRIRSGAGVPSVEGERGTRPHREPRRPP